jgi:hypothetical protein
VLAAAALVTATWAADARAQAIAYRNLLQFDLQSYRSQATGGVFSDDVDLIADAARLLEIDGTRIYTNFSNLSDPATLGDNLITYSITSTSDFASNSPRPGVSNSPSVGADTFDSGSYLGGWVGKYDQDSKYTFSIIYQRSGHKAMFEDLDDGNIGSGFNTSTDAEYTADILQGFDNGLNDGPGGSGAGDGDVDQDTRLLSDLQRYDDRSATRFDLGAARELEDTDWSVGGRLFWRSDHIERIAEGTTSVISRQKAAYDSTGDSVPDVYSTELYETGRTETTWSGSMEDAFRMREAGVSLNGDWHPGGWALNTRVDVFGVNVTNPSSGLFGPSRGASSSSLPWFMSGDSPAIFEQRFHTVVTTDSVDLDSDGTFDALNRNPNGALGSLDQDRVNTSWQTGPYYLGDYFEYDRGLGLAVESVDDERTGIGFAAKMELDRPRWGGDQRTWVGFNRRPMDIDATIVLAERQGTSFWWNDGVNGDQMATQVDFEDELTVSWSGDATNTVLEAGTKWWRELSNRVEMGLGVVLTRSTYNQEYTETDTQTSVTRFDDGFGDLGGNELDAFQGGLGIYNEEQTTQTATFVIDVNDETKATDIRLPVGAQFNITKKIKWQMGVQHQITYWTRETSGTVPADMDGVTVTVFNDYNNPANDFTTYDTGLQESGTLTITDKDEFNTTTYWYGVEWLVGDVAQFNINGFFDTSSTSTTPTSMGGSNLFDVDFFRNLAVSLTFMFD